MSKVSEWAEAAQRFTDLGLPPEVDRPASFVMRGEEWHRYMVAHVQDDPDLLFLQCGAAATHCSHAFMSRAEALRLAAWIQEHYA